MRDAKAIGRRIARFRSAQGLSQPELGEKVGLAGATISKYEREGLHDIEVIDVLSTALGHNLLVDEVDAEGSVGEIGKEILLRLLCGGRYHGKITPGSFDITEIINNGSFYGLSSERLTSEILKLEGIGLCVREQFVDFYDENQDWLFITAKGVMALKHMDSFTQNEDEIDIVQTYEQVCGDKDFYQEVVNSDEAQKLIRQLAPKNAFRINFIEYLQKNYETGLGARNSEGGYSFFPGNNCFYDLMFSMSVGLSRETADTKMERYVMDDEIYEKIAELEKQLHINDPLLNDFDNRFSVDVCEIEGHTDNALYVNEEPISEELGSLYDAACEAVIDVADSPEESYKIEAKHHLDKNPLDWFSKEDIVNYIDNNILEPSTEEEILLDKQIKTIIRKKPEVMRYFKFPYAWEQNGLAEIIRDKYNY